MFLLWLLLGDVKLRKWRSGWLWNIDMTASSEIWSDDMFCWMLSCFSPYQAQSLLCFASDWYWSSWYLFAGLSKACPRRKKNCIWLISYGSKLRKPMNWWCTCTKKYTFSVLLISICNEHWCCHNSQHVFN